MPKKSKRIAARQAQLSGRAKRLRPHGPAGVPATYSAPQADELGGGSASVGRQPSTAMTAQQKVSPEARSVTAASASRSRGKAPPIPSIETYFFPELRRIAIASALIVGILVALMFVLR